MVYNWLARHFMVFRLLFGKPSARPNTRKFARVTSDGRTIVDTSRLFSDGDFKKRSDRLQEIAALLVDQTPDIRRETPEAFAASRVAR